MSRLRSGGGLAGLLLGLLLTLQLGVAQLAMHRAGVAEADPLASLSAAIGQPVVLCHHGRGGSDDPAQPGDCDHCPLCRLAAHSVAVLLADPVAAPRAQSIVVAIDRPLVGFGLTRPVHAGGATSRGPPRLA